MNCDFSFKHYQEILESAQEAKYEFVSFEELLLESQSKQCVLRHDIDYSPVEAVRMAEIESKLGIQSTYFYQSCAWTYNLREKEVYQAVHEVKALGHKIGVHLDVFWNEKLDFSELSKFLSEEKQLFKEILGFEAENIFSFHNPHKFKELVLNQTVKGIYHTYEPRFFSEIKYLSDSQGWYEGCMCNIFKSQKYSHIQLLTHPYIWSDRINSNFSNDMAHLIVKHTKDYFDYMTRGHPVADKNKEKILEKIKELTNLL